MDNKMNDTINYYNENAEAFIERTFFCDAPESYKRFLEFIPEKGYILDAGCGSGRDSLFFINKGYRVLGLDASEEMVKHSEKVTRQKVLHTTFQEADFEDETFDGVWARASLLHIHREEIDTVVAKLYAALKPGGAFYVAFKYGDMEHTEGTRFFNCYTEDTVLDIFKELEAYKLVTVEVTTDVRPDKLERKWVNCIIQKI
ncbi:MAG: class I SAM-dependent methyltransferase [Clostridiales bacterium]|nr:class I SAM-dependent methyltransferase [Clostridiales bacterium]